jgi:hypothetical protein
MSSLPFTVGTTSVDGGGAVYRQQGFLLFFFFFSLSFPENYRLVIFVVDMSTSLPFLLIFNFYHFNSLNPYRSQSTKNSRFLTVNMGRNLF